jgi:hypothetical protein
MQSTLIPVNLILRHPAGSGTQPVTFLQLVGWVESLLGSVPGDSRRNVEFRSSLTLSLRSPETEMTLGRISGDFLETLAPDRGKAVLIERKFDVSGELDGHSLVMIFRVMEHQVDIPYVQIRLDDKCHEPGISQQ